MEGHHMRADGLWEGLAEYFFRVGRLTYFEKLIETPGEAPCSEMVARLLITCVSSGMAVAITVGYLNILPRL